MTDDNYTHIELRSEKTRHLIGAMPPWIIRYGTAILFILTIILLAASYYIPYPESIEARATIMPQKNGTIRATASIPYEYVSRIKPDMKALFEPEGYSNREYPMIQGTITCIDTKVATHDGIRCFTAQIILPPDNRLQSGMEGKIHILLTQKSFLQRLLRM